MGLETVLEQARGLEIQGKYQEAVDFLTPEIEGQLREQNEDPLFSDLLNLQGNIEESLSQISPASFNYNEALSRATSDRQRAEALTNQAKLYIIDFGRRDMEIAHVLLDDAQRYVEEGSLTEAKIFEYRGLAYMEEEKVVAAIDALETASRIATSLILGSENSKYVQYRYAGILYQLGIAYEASDSVYVRRQAPGVASIALGTFTRLENPVGIAKIKGKPWVNFNP